MVREGFLSFGFGLFFGLDFGEGLFGRDDFAVEAQFQKPRIVKHFGVYGQKVRAVINGREKVVK